MNNRATYIINHFQNAAKSGKYSSEANNLFHAGCTLLEKTSNDQEIDLITTGTLICALAVEFKKYQTYLNSDPQLFMERYGLTAPILPIPVAPIMDVYFRLVDSTPPNNLNQLFIQNIGVSALAKSNGIFFNTTAFSGGHIKVLIDNCLPDKLKATVALFSNNLFSPANFDANQQPKLTRPREDEDGDMDMGHGLSNNKRGKTA